MCKAPQLAQPPAPPPPPRSAFTMSGAARLEASSKSERAARLERWHDQANIGALGIIFACALSSLRGGGPGHLATTYVSAGYLLLDLGLVLGCPDMFKSPGPIALHHVITIALHWHPIAEPAHAEYASAAPAPRLSRPLPASREPPPTRATRRHGAPRRAQHARPHVATAPRLPSGPRADLLGHLGLPPPRVVRPRRLLPSFRRPRPIGRDRAGTRASPGA